MFIGKIAQDNFLLYWFNETRQGANHNSIFRTICMHDKIEHARKKSKDKSQAVTNPNFFDVVTRVTSDSCRHYVTYIMKFKGIRVQQLEAQNFGRK